MLVLLSDFWGGSFFFVEIALRGFQPFTIVFLRVVLAALILAGAVYLGGQRMPSSPKVWGAYFVMGCIFLGLMVIDGRVLNRIKNVFCVRHKIRYNRKMY